MSDVFDATFRALAVKLVNKFGVASASYVSRQSDNSQPVLSGDAEREAFMTGVILPATGDADVVATITTTPLLRYKSRDTDGTIVLNGDTYVLIAAPNWETAFGTASPQITDELTISGRTLYVQGFEPIYSGVLVAAYKIQLRDGGK